MDRFNEEGQLPPRIGISLFPEGVKSLESFYDNSDREEYSRNFNIPHIGDIHLSLYKDVESHKKAFFFNEDGNIGEDTIHELVEKGYYSINLYINEDGEDVFKKSEAKGDIDGIIWINSNVIARGHFEDAGGSRNLEYFQGADPLATPSLLFVPIKDELLKKMKFAFERTSNDTGGELNL